MTIESVLITIRSLLDKQPYLHEPGQQNNEAFNAYVRYNTWRWLLLDYLDREKDSPALAFLQNHLRQSGAAMIAELEAAKAAHRYNIYMASPYALYSRNLVFDYNKLLSDLKARIKALPEAPAGPPAMEDSKLKRKLPFEPEYVVPLSCC